MHVWWLQVFTYDGRAAMQSGLRLKLLDRFQKVLKTEFLTFVSITCVL